MCLIRHIALFTVIRYEAQNFTVIRCLGPSPLATTLLYICIKRVLFVVNVCYCSYRKYLIFEQWTQCWYTHHSSFRNTMYLGNVMNDSMLYCNRSVLGVYNLNVFHLLHLAELGMFHLGWRLYRCAVSFWPSFDPYIKYKNFENGAGQNP